MTLIVARKTGNEIRMCSDAKITYPDNLRNNPLKGALKLITTNDLCIGYAGNYHVALEAIREVRKQNLTDYGQATDFLFKAHKDSDMSVDFIIAVYLPTLMLIKISEGSVDMDLDSTWIGDSDAFSEYQKLYHLASPTTSEAGNEQETKKYEVASRMTEALGQLVREKKYESVGDFTVSVLCSDKGFRYLGNAMVFPVSQEIPPGVATKLKFGTAQQGGYSYSVLESRTPNLGAVGVHFFQGNIGALYHPLESDEAIIYSTVTFEDFKQAVMKDYGIKIDGLKIS